MPALFQDLIFTPSCLGCQRIGQPVCATCISNLKPVIKPEIFNLSKAIALHSYDGWLRDCVIEYKSGEYEFGRNLAELFCFGLNKYFPGLPVIPIPCSALKIAQREIDTVGNIAKLIHRLDRKTEIKSALALTKNVVEQVGLSEKQRLQNMHGAFRATKKISGPVVIIDDVITTGATLAAAGQALLNAGANQVFGLGLCAAQKNGIT